MTDEWTPEAVRAWAEGLVRGVGSKYNVPLSRAILSLFARHEQTLGLLREMHDHWGMCSQWLERRNALLADVPVGRPPDKGELCQCDHCPEGALPATAGQLTTMDHDIERRLTKVEQTITEERIAYLLEGQRLYDLTVPPLVARVNEREASEQQNKDRIVALERRLAELETWRCDVDIREEARLDDIFEPSSQQRATPQGWRPSTEKPTYDLQGIEHRVLVAEGHAVPFGDGWLLKPHRWRERTPETSDEPRCPTCDGDGEVVEDQDDEGRPILVVPCPDCSEALAAELLQIAQEPSLRGIAGEASGDEPKPVCTASIRGMQDLAARCIALAEYCDRLQERLTDLELRIGAIDNMWQRYGN